MENENNEKQRIWMTLDVELSEDFRGFCNGASYADGLRALLHNAKETGCAPFGYNEKKED